MINIDGFEVFVIEVYSIEVVLREEFKVLLMFV